MNIDFPSQSTKSMAVKARIRELLAAFSLQPFVNPNGQWMESTTGELGVASRPGYRCPRPPPWPPPPAPLIPYPKPVPPPRPA